MLLTSGIQKNCVGDDGATHLGGALEVNESLTKLSLMVRLQPRSDSTQLREGPWHSHRLRVWITDPVDKGCRIGDVGAMHLAKGLMGNAVLKTLHLQVRSAAKDAAD